MSLAPQRIGIGASVPVLGLETKALARSRGGESPDDMRGQTGGHCQDGGRQGCGDSRGESWCQTIECHSSSFEAATARFDIGFVDADLARLRSGRLAAPVIDTVALPGG